MSVKRRLMVGAVAVVLWIFVDLVATAYATFDPDVQPPGGGPVLIALTVGAGAGAGRFSLKRRIQLVRRSR